MPQMMPLNWLTMFLFFSILLIIFNMMNYYSPSHKSNYSLSTKMTIKTMTWKW
uniref:ATP synthase F0 subunit 8 n=1 Tax=Phyllocrania paradoxa TaxID=267208 RepID=UPI001C32B09F|nr:ATP synthase F0 subunit 8 [Phyllocrania paradoxa]WVH38925.1 ATP synthase F0 subunit 8 [Phyllocrania paradoxa]